jgi:hypothetical protein
MILFLAWIILSAIVSLLAKKRGRSPIAFLFLSLLLSPLIGGLILVFMVAAEKPELCKRCPHCAETILLDAKVCKHCRRDIIVPESHELLTNNGTKDGIYDNNKPSDIIDKWASTIDSVKR